MTLKLTRENDEQEGGYEKVFSFLREQLVTGKLKQGDRLRSERELSLMLGVSRPILREALRALSMFGVIDIRHGVGSVISTPDLSVLGEFFTFALAQRADAIDDVMEGRIAMECQAVRLACSRAKLADLEVLRAAADRIAGTIDDPVAGAEADYAFHSSLVKAAASETLSAVYGAIADLIYRSHLERRALVGADAKTKKIIIEDHYNILRTLAEQDPEKAEAVVRRHFEIGKEIRLGASLRFEEGRSNG
jgi:DNA-binding FadR family transcriptional regulator